MREASLTCAICALLCSIWAVASAGLSPDDEWLEAFLLAFESAAPANAQPQHLANTVWALARLGVAPDAEWLEVVVGTAAASLQSFTPRDAAQFMAGFAALGLDLKSVGPSLLKGLRNQLLAGLEQAPTSGSNAWWGWQRAGSRSRAQGLLPTPSAFPNWQDAPEHAARESSFEGRRDGAHALSSGLWAMAVMSAVPPTAWMDRVRRCDQGKGDCDRGGGGECAGGKGDRGAGLGLEVQQPWLQDGAHCLPLALQPGASCAAPSVAHVTSMPFMCRPLR